ncbi:unnamed protein product [Durusdinium trenchii]|uniref:Pentatricopeptide repeat-containing protein, chloroplastic n=1 Tax=Durusdinium trenchii TaxID=1381693 RepID=A0ABP0M664_9DINO
MAKEPRSPVAEALRTGPRQATSVLCRLKAPEALQWLRWMQEHQVEANVFHYSAVMSTCEKASEWQSAVALLAQMLQGAGALPDTVVCNAAISALEKGGGWQLALALLEELKNFSVEADVISFNSVIRGLDWRDGLQITQCMKQRQVFPNTVTTNCLIDACSSWPWALHLFATVQPAERTLVTYNASLSACGVPWQWKPGPRPFDEPGGSMSWSVAAWVLAAMPVQRVSADLISSNATMDACAKGAATWQWPLTMLMDLHRARGLHDVVSFAGGLGACEQVKDWEMAYDLLRCMAAWHVEPNHFCFNAALSSSSAWPRSLQLAGDLLKEDVVSCNALLLSLTWRRAMGMLAWSMQVQLQPNLTSYSTALLSLEGRWTHALQLFSSMEVTDVISFNSALGAHKMSMSWRSAAELLQSMRKTWTPTVISYASATSACEASGVEGGEGVREGARREEKTVPFLASCTLQVSQLFTTRGVRRGQAIAADRQHVLQHANRGFFTSSFLARVLGASTVSQRNPSTSCGS